MIILQTERLLFRDHEPEDLDLYCQMEADPEVRRYVGGSPRTRDAAERRFHEVYLPAVKDRMGLWATVFKPAGRYIGYCGIYPHFGPDGAIIQVEGVLAFYLARSFWGQGIATEAGRAFVRFGFDELHLSRILATADSRHAVSIHVLEKLGFRWLLTDTGEKRSIHKFELLNPSVAAIQPNKDSLPAQDSVS